MSSDRASSKRCELNIFTMKIFFVVWLLMHVLDQHGSILTMLRDCCWIVSHPSSHSFSLKKVTYTNFSAWIHVTVSNHGRLQCNATFFHIVGLHVVRRWWFAFSLFRKERCNFGINKIQGNQLSLTWLRRG